MKGYKLEIEPHEDYLFAYYEAGKDSISLSNKLWKEISVQMKNHGFSKLLVVENIKDNPGSVIEMYSIVNAAVRLGFAGKSVAFVDLVEEHYSANQFGETLAVNLGVNAQIFKTIEEAQKWLKAQP